MTQVLKFIRLNNLFISKRTFQTINCKFQKAQEENTEEKFTHFGYEDVKENEKNKRVHKVFKDVALTYDKMNDAMSLGVHRIWKDCFIQNMAPPLGTKLLDVAGGTGDISFRYVNYILQLPGYTKEEILNSDSHVTVADINEHMLKVGEERANNLNLPKHFLSWKIEDAEKLSFKNNSFDVYSISFGIRNVTRIDKCLAEAYRVLKPGGRFMCLEFSQLNNTLAQWVYDQYSFTMIPVMGQLIAGQIEPYKYLVESIRKFPDQETFKTMIQQAGFRNVTYENLSLGICAIHSGFKI